MVSSKGKMPDVKKSFCGTLEKAGKIRVKNVFILLKHLISEVLRTLYINTNFSDFTILHDVVIVHFTD